MKTKTTKSNVLAVRLYPDDRQRFDRIARQLKLSPSALVRYMMRYCARVNLDGTGWDLKSDFEAAVSKWQSTPLFGGRQI